MKHQNIYIHLVSTLLLFLLSSCATPIPSLSEKDSVFAYYTEEDNLISQTAPVILVRQPEDDFNRIGTPTATASKDSGSVITITTEHATVYTEQRDWTGTQGKYRNLIYRVHFPEVPFRLLPFNLIAGKNVGLFVIVTLDQDLRPVLYTTVHTCGCYLAFIPTKHLSAELYPADWPEDRQFVYGENLPSLLPVPEINERLYLLIRESTHRIENIWIDHEKNKHAYPNDLMHVAHISDLQALTMPDGATSSFFETKGNRKDYVVNSHKIWERFFISWWAFDWRVGEDKRLGKDTNDGVVFYTSLKPWSRKSSDLRDFANFLNYWGWKL